MSNLAKIIPVKEQISLFEEVKDILDGYNIQSVSDTSGVATATLYFWLDGTTRLPRLDTVIRVADALGYELVLVPKEKKGKKRPHLRVIK